MRTSLLVPATLALLAASARAQIELPKKSPHAVVTQEVGTTEVSIDYHRPAVRGRTIWGELVPYDATWRAGANAATVISLGADATVAGHAVPKGRYALFVVPKKEGAWTVILNSVSEQWGSYNHDPEKDVARFEVAPKTVEKQEYLRFTIEPTDVDKAEVRLAWDKLQLAFPVAVDVSTQVQAQIREALASRPDDWRVYYQAASWTYETEGDLGQALEWVNRSVELEQGTRNLVLLAQLLHATGDTQEAIPPMERAIELARPQASEKYVRGLERELAAWRKAR